MATLANICFSKCPASFFLKIAPSHPMDGYQGKKMKTTFCQYFTQGNAFRVGDLENKRASAPPRADSYLGNAQL
jgi:hypothetical protein